MLFDRTVAAKVSFVKFGAAACGLLALATTAGGDETARAAERSGVENDYARALRIAQRHVERKRNVQNALSPQSEVAAVANRPMRGAADAYARFRGSEYRVGDTWTVAAQQALPTAMRRTSEPGLLEPSLGPVVLFRYRVVALEPNLRLEITQAEQPGTAPADARVEKITIEVNAATEQVSKSYHFRGKQRPAKVSPEGIRSRVSPLELYPLDVPEILTAEISDAKEFPSVPPRLRDTATRLGASLSPPSREAKWMEQDDFFGRPVQLLWRPGDPWPAYLKNAQGLAVLLPTRGQEAR